MPRSPTLQRSLSFILVLSAAFTLPIQAGAAFGRNTPGLYNDNHATITQPEVKPKRNSQDPVTLESDEMGYDEDNGIVIARGHVDIAQGQYVLNADQVTYYQNRNLVVAEGNVVMLQPTGEVVFADKATLRDNMKAGVIRAFKARLSDNSVLVANHAVRVNSNVTKLNQASYTPCNVCATMAPFWQLNGERVKVDDGSERVLYHDVSMDMMGVPVFYSPYLAHPTPNSAGQSGFLMPEYKGGNTTFGSILKTPYYWRISEDKDVVLTPWFTSEQGPLLQGDYRELTDNGKYRVQGSITDPRKLDSSGNEVPGNSPRGAIFATGEEALDDESRIGFDIQRATDDTYLRRYGFGAQTALFSRAYIETAEGRNFAQAQGLAIQGLRATDDSKTTPLVLPMFQLYYETEPDENNIRYHISGDAQSMTRDVGVDQRRLSVTLGATHPYVTDGGHIFTSTLNLRQDLYNSDNVPLNGGLDEFSGTTMRTLPQAALEWRYPLIKQYSTGAMTIEPIVLAVAQANGGNSADISNEDNRLIELTDTNLFSLNRMPGLDTVDTGPRMAYGFRSQYLLSSGTSFDALFGQNYNANDDTPFPNSTTPGEHFSDYIGRVAFNYDPVSLAYRYALDNGTLSLNRSEVTLGFSKPWLTVATSYRMLDNNTYLNNSEEGSLDVSLPLSDEWTVYGGARRDFDIGAMVTSDAGIIYKNECFNIMLDAIRTYARDRDVTPQSQITLRVGFKNLGEFGGK